jgi:hypothetical protein
MPKEQLLKEGQNRGIEPKVSSSSNQRLRAENPLPNVKSFYGTKLCTYFLALAIGK